MNFFEIKKFNYNLLIQNLKSYISYERKQNITFYNINFFPNFI